MNTLTVFLIIGFFVLSFALIIVYTILAKKSSTRKMNKANQRVISIYNDTNIAKVALLINLESINNNPFNKSAVYYAKVKSHMTGASQVVEIALLQPGEYTFVVNSREFKKKSMQVVVDPGKIYQLGADANGPYFMVDPHGERYAMKEL